MSALAYSEWYFMEGCIGRGLMWCVAIVTSERGSWRLTQSPEDVAIDLSM